MVDAVPVVNRRLYFVFVVFAPSIVFWPSSLGKEALMQLGLGAVASATSLAYRSGSPQGPPAVAGGGWLLYTVRPHLLALVTVAAAALLLRPDRRAKAGSILSRPVGMVVVGVLIVFTVTAGAKFLGIQDLSVESVQDQLDQERHEREGRLVVLERLQLAQSAVGSERRRNGALPPVSVGVPQRTPAPGIARVGGRVRHSSCSGSIPFVSRSSDVERYPFILYCLILLLLYSMTFSSFANFGLLNRQRSLVLPALYALIALEPALARGDDRLDHVTQPDSVNG